MSAITLHDQAYLKAVLHAAKRPSNAITGLLIGDPALPNEILDSLPFQHNSLSFLSPMTTAGLSLAKQHVKAQKKEVLGLYAASSRMGDTELHPTRKILAQEIARQLGKDAVVLVVRHDRLSRKCKASEKAQLDNSKLGSSEDLPFLVSLH
jgi:hypothetical protein